MSRYAGLACDLNDSVRAMCKSPTKRKTQRESCLHTKKVPNPKALDSPIFLENTSLEDLAQMARVRNGQTNDSELLGVSAVENSADEQFILQLFLDYLRMYSSRNDGLTAQFSQIFSGFTGGGNFLVKDREEWIAITRQDFAQVKDPIRIELKDLAIQSLSETIAVATGFFKIHLPIEDEVLSRQTARLVLIFRKETPGWKIAHSSISIPYDLVATDEVYPLKELSERNRSLKNMVDERTSQLKSANDNLEKVNKELESQIAQHKLVAEALRKSDHLYRSIIHASPDNITITHNDGKILVVSPVALSMFGAKSEEDFFGRSLTDFIVPEDRGRALSRVATNREGAVTGPSEYGGLRVDGSTFSIEVNSEFIRDADGSPTRMGVLLRDITERQHAEAEREELKRRGAEHAAELERLNEILRGQALEDSLTGLANRRQFVATLEREVRRARRYKTEIALLIADVDFFKGYNDRCALCPHFRHKYCPPR